MQLVYLALIVAGLFPLARACQKNRRTSLVHAVSWACAAWAAWAAALVFGAPHETGYDPWRYLALCCTGAAGVAVLGARWPQAAAWNFVVLGLLAVMLLPLGEHLVLGTPPLDGLRLIFLGAILTVAILNYVPTALAGPALLLGGACGGECMLLLSAMLPPAAVVGAHLGLLLVPWWAWAMSCRSRLDETALNRLWRDFRDRFGLFWGQRLREQYNRGAAQAGLPGRLHWRGWNAGQVVPTEAQAHAMVALFQALLKRFCDR
jgi:hypothetical protein